ncbi:MAG: AtpZ/AtpI family protein [Eubacteriales bacterium]|nr:AtpZ/AtpI family protein [Eubacteriales bacterium]
MAKHSFNRTVWQCLALISQFGIMMLVPMAMMFAAGYWLDRRLGTQFWTVLLFFVGALAGFGNVYRLARRIYGAKGRKGGK